ncbi:MAG: hypothetical protein ACRENS_11735, partial [Candidatus Eiseniibacteriota bacterium]
MKRIEICALLALGALAGCMAGSPAPSAGPAAPIRSGSAQADGGEFAVAPAVAAPLLLDRTDLTMGTTVEFHHLPSVVELQDASDQFALRHVVVVLPGWPQLNADLSRFAALPPEADAIVILPGYPPDRSALDAWNLAHGRIRLVVVVDGPPPDSIQLDDLNT